MIAEAFSSASPDQSRQAERQPVELIGTHLRVAGVVDLRGWARLSDFVTMQSGWFRVCDATVLSRRGTPTADTIAELTVRISDLTMIAQRVAWPPPPVGDDIYVDKVRYKIMAVTAGHTVQATVALYPGADLLTFMQASDPPFLPLVDARVRWLADRRLKTRYEFLLLNRAHVGAVSGLD